MLVALFCALVALSGVVQARAGTELAAKSGFTQSLALCNPSGQDDNAPDEASGCDHCRMPCGIALPGLVPAWAALVFSARPGLQPATPMAIAGLSFHHPEARGPPVAG